MFQVLCRDSGQLWIARGEEKGTRVSGIEPADFGKCVCVESPSYYALFVHVLRRRRSAVAPIISPLCYCSGQLFDTYIHGISQ